MVGHLRDHITSGRGLKEQELQSRVLALTRKTSVRMEEKTGVEASLTEEDMKKYLDEVLKEIRSTKGNPLNR